MWVFEWMPDDNSRYHATFPMDHGLQNVGNYCEAAGGMQYPVVGPLGQEGCGEDPVKD